MKLVEQNMHRVEGEAEWNGIAHGEMNAFQVVADATNGLVTPGNLVSAAGIWLVYNGLDDINNGRVAKGTFEIWLGRMADMVDGFVAHNTGTKSPLGEGVDAMTDKLAMAAALGVLVHNNIVPKKSGALILGQQVASGALSVTARKRGNQLHPSLEGKHTAALQWLAIGGYCVSHALNDENPALSQQFEMASAGFVSASTILGGIALRDYGRQALRG